MVRQISASRELGIDPRTLSIDRVDNDPLHHAKVSFVVKRKEIVNSTIFGPPAEVTIGTYVGRFDEFAIARTTRSERYSPAGLASSARGRLEVPYPTDSEGNVVDIQRGDKIIINGTEFKLTNLGMQPGFIEALLEDWS